MTIFTLRLSPPPLLPSFLPQIFPACSLSDQSQSQSQNGPIHGAVAAEWYVATWVSPLDAIPPHTPSSSSFRCHTHTHTILLSFRCHTHTHTPSSSSLPSHFSCLFAENYTLILARTYVPALVSITLEETYKSLADGYKSGW